MKRRLLIYMDRSSGEWVIIPNCISATLEQVKSLSAREVLALLKPGVIQSIAPGQTYYSVDRQGLLKDLQWRAAQFLKADWYWEKRGA